MAVEEDEWVGVPSQRIRMTNRNHTDFAILLSIAHSSARVSVLASIYEIF